MKKNILGLLVVLLIIIPNTFVSAETTTKTICVNDKGYEIKNWGSKVDVWQINEENIANNSILPTAYFDMKNDFIRKGLNVTQVDSYLETYKSNQMFNGNNNGLLTQNTNVISFLNTHYNTYINSEYYLALTNNNIEKTYNFESSYLARSCFKDYSSVNDSYITTFCPSVEISRIYNSNNFSAVVSQVKFNETKKVFEYTVSDKSDKIIDAATEDVVGSFGGNLAIRVVRVDGSNLTTDKFNKNSYDLSDLYSMNIANPKEIVNLQKNKTITNTLNPGETVYLEFYLKEDVTGAEYSKCAGTMLGYLLFSAPTYAYINNPYIDSQVCKNLKDNDIIDDSYKRAYVSDCYREKVEYFSEIENGSLTLDKIREDIKEVNKVFENWDSSQTTVTNLKCHYNPQNKTQVTGSNGQGFSYRITSTKTLEKAVSQKKYVYNPNGSKYWAASCTEKLTVLYDQPKQVIAGAGFSYVAKIELERTCTPTLLKQVKSLPPCEYGVECYGGPPGNVHHGGPGAGPNEDFDSCILSCDGGEYTKDCVNSCYGSVYEGKESNIDKTFSFLEVVKANNLNLVNNSENTKVTKIASTSLQPGQSTSRGSIVVGPPVTSNSDSQCSRSSQSCTSKISGITYPYANMCNNGSNPVVCYDVQLSGACGGSNEAEKSASKSDYNALVRALKKYNTSETAKISIIDSYNLNSSETDLLKTTWTSNSGMLNSNIPWSSSEVNTGASIAYADDDSISNIPRVTVNKSYEVKIPKAYIKILSYNAQDVRYVKSGTSISSNERDGGNKYYTDIKSGIYNDYYYTKWQEGETRINSATINSNKVGSNIEVIFTNVGTSGHYWDKVNIDCFYGIYNQYNIECEEPVCDNPDNPPSFIPECSDSDVCTFGIQYMFRQVNLNNLFPDRNPRWNWTYTANIGNSYVSNASKIIEEIETTGNDAYSHEPEYEFIITRNDIERIRNYNDGKSTSTNKTRSYQVYDDMTCDTVQGSGIQTCYSGFMDKYVTSLTRNTTFGQNTNRNG